MMFKKTRPHLTSGRPSATFNNLLLAKAPPTGCCSLTITSLSAPAPRPPVKPRTAPIIRYPKLKRRPLTRNEGKRDVKQIVLESRPPPRRQSENCGACLWLVEYGLSESDLDSLAAMLDDLSDKDVESDYRDELIIEGIHSIDDDGYSISSKERITNITNKHETSKALYYTLASSTVLEKTSTSVNTRELDNVFLAAAKYGDMDILLRTLDRHSININVRDETSGDTALILAAKGNNTKVVEALVERGADVTVLNEDGKSALDMASNHLKLAVLSKYPKASSDCGMAIIKAAWQGDVISLRSFLSSRPNHGTKYLNGTSVEGLTPLLVVTRDVNVFLRLQRSIKLTYDPLKVIQELLKYKVDVNAMDIEGHTALHFATRITAHHLAKDIVDLLLLHGPLINTLDRTNLAPLHTATNNDNVAVVAALVASGANPNLHGIGGATSLHIGAQQDNEEMIRRLIIAGGDLNELDNAGMTPLCVARSSKLRQLMKSLYLDQLSSKGEEVKLKYDELSHKRRLQRMLEPTPTATPERRNSQHALETINSKLDFKPLQRKLFNNKQKQYDYNVNQRVPRVDRKQTVVTSKRRTSNDDKHVVSMLPRIDRDNPMLLLKRHTHSPIEVPILQRHTSRLKQINPGVFITQRQTSHRKMDKSRGRPPIPKHTCGYVNNAPTRQGSAKTRKSEKAGSQNSGGEEQWLPGAPMITGCDTNSSSRPSSGFTISSQSQRGPKILQPSRNIEDGGGLYHPDFTDLKEVLKNILANMETNGYNGEDLLTRYVKQQRPVRVKEMGFVDFLLQDDDPEKMSEASFRSTHCSDSSSVSGHSYKSVIVETSNPLSDTITISNITIGDTQLVNLPVLCSNPENGYTKRSLTDPIQQRPNKLSLSRKDSVEQISTSRKNSLDQISENSPVQISPEDPNRTENVSIFNISSPFINSPQENPKISSRSSRDSGYSGSVAGSTATLFSNKAQQAEEVEESPPKHITSVIVMQERRSSDTVSNQKGSDTEMKSDSESDGEFNISDAGIDDEIPINVSDETPHEDGDKTPINVPEEKEEKPVTKPSDIVKSTNSHLHVPKHDDFEPIKENSAPNLGISDIGILKGQRMKTMPKLLNMRTNKAREPHTFKKKVYNRKLPQIKEEKSHKSAVSRLKKKDKRLSKSAKSGSSAGSSQRSNATVISHVDSTKPITGTIKTRPKTSGPMTTATKIEVKVPEDVTLTEDVTLISSVKMLGDVHDKALLKQINSVKDLDKLVSTLPLQVDDTYDKNSYSRDTKQLFRTTSDRSIKSDHSSKNSENKDARSLYSERRSILTDFTGTTKIESIMGETTKWKKGCLLGAGACGKVWHGVTSEKIEVAVKQIELCGDHEDARDEYFKLQDEVRLLKCLKHDNIIRYYGTCLQDNNVNIFMEFVDGGSLASRIKKYGTLPERLIQNITYQLLDALSYIHAKNIVHRDIKSQNILITEDDKVKMIDFGCSKRLRRSLKNADALKTFRGTPYWMSPEVIKEAGHGTKSDIWSLSCTVYEMLTGNPPWHSYPTMAAMYKIGTGKAVPSYPDNASDYCIDFMKSSFIVDPKDRPTAEDLMKHEFIELFSNRIKGDKFEYLNNL